MTLYRGFRFPKAIIQHAIWLYLRFTLCLRNVEGLLTAQRFLAAHAAVAKTFTACRHLISAATHHQFRSEASAAWREAAVVAA